MNSKSESNLRTSLKAQLTILEILSDAEYEDYILRLFDYQYKYNAIYQDYCKDLGKTIESITDMSQIPYLPISAFKHHSVKTGAYDAVTFFQSSGTTAITQRSQAHVREMDLYLDNATRIFTDYFGSPTDFCFLALLPNYLRQGHSSLVAMVAHFQSLSKYDQSNFYLDDTRGLADALYECKIEGIPTVLFGVPYALLDFIEGYETDFPHLIIIETGGMKGRRAELDKYDLHAALSKGFGTEHIVSEYGMTELFSQAYAVKDGVFNNSRRLNISIHQINDPLTIEKNGKVGIITIMDLANIDTCAFVQTEDLGILRHDGTFMIAGRLDVSDIRGCNLMVQEI